MAVSLFSALTPCHAASYSPAVKAGQFLFVSGQFPINPDTGLMEDGDIASLTHLTMSHVKSCVLRNRFKMNEVVKTVVYLCDIRDYNQMDQAYAAWFPYAHPPARDVIVVSDLPGNARIEISCIASSKH